MTISEESVLISGIVSHSVDFVSFFSLAKTATWPSDNFLQLMMLNFTGNILLPQA